MLLHSEVNNVKAHWSLSQIQMLKTQLNLPNDSLCGRLLAAGKVRGEDIVQDQLHYGAIQNTKSRAR
jgi:hypothetical protein